MYTLYVHVYVCILSKCGRFTSLVVSGYHVDLIRLSSSLHIISCHVHIHVHVPDIMLKWTCSNGYFDSGLLLCQLTSN